MKIFNYKVENRKITYIGNEEVSIVGDSNVDTFSFEFDSEWNDFSIKEIRFYKEGNWYYSNLDEENKVVLPNGIYGSTEFEFGLTGKNSTSQLSTELNLINTNISVYLASGDPVNIPGKEAWDIYTEEMVSLLNEGRINLEQLNQMLEDFRTYYQTCITNMEQMKNDTEGFKNDAQDILENAQAVKQDIIDMGSSRTFATFYLDAKTGKLYVVNAESLGNMGFFLRDGKLYVSMKTEINSEV